MSKYIRTSTYYQANFGLIDNAMGGIDRFGTRIGRGLRSMGISNATKLVRGGASPEDWRVKAAMATGAVGILAKNPKLRRITGLVGLGALGLGGAGLAGAGYLGYKAYQNGENNNV